MNPLVPSPASQARSTLVVRQSAGPNGAESDDSLIPRANIGSRRDISFKREILEGLVKALDLGIIVTATAGVFHRMGSYGPAQTTNLHFLALLTSLLSAMLFIAGFDRIGGYEVAQLARIRWQLTHTAAVWATTGLILLGAGFLCEIFESYRVIPVLRWVVTIGILLLLQRCVVRAAVARWSRQGYLARNVVIVGAGEEGQRLIAKLQNSQGMGVVIQGVFDDRRSRVPDVLSGCHVLGSTDLLVRLARELSIDEVIISLPLGADQRVKALIEKFSPLAIDLRLSAESIADNFRVRGVSCIGDVPLLGILECPIKSWNAVIKWCEDKLVSAILLVLLAPLMALIALLIKLESKGSIFFVQERFGFNNNVIRVRKFRTMYADRCDSGGARRTVRGDPRVTRVGRVLRSFSLDELPQLFNVLMGEMSVVGPRPHPLPMMAGARLFCDAVEEYAHRHRVKPGITGWAQVNGYRGEVDTIEKARTRVEYDLFYIDQWSLWIDLKILALTVPALLRRHNAY